MKALTEILRRFSGKKQFTAILGIGAIVYLVDTYLGIPSEERAGTTHVFAAAALAIGVLVAGFAVGQGLGDQGERKG